MIKNQSQKIVLLDFKREDMESIEKLPGFKPVSEYHDISNNNPRTWGYLSNKSEIFIFRIINQEEKIQDLIANYYEIKIRLSRITKLCELGIIDLNTIEENMTPLIKLCDYMIDIFKD